MQLSSCDKVVISSTQIFYTLYAGRGGKLNNQNFKLTSLNMSLTATNRAFLLYRRMRRKAKAASDPRNTLSTNRNLEGSEVCTDKNQHCSDSRSGPEKNRLVTVWLQVRASHQNLCQFLWWPQRQRNQRLKQTMNLNGCAAVQFTSRVSLHNPCGIHAVHCAIQRPCVTVTGSPRSTSRESRGASTTARTREHHKFQRPSPCRS